MSVRRRAQLLLPTPLGLVEYDVLEETVFIGPAQRGGWTARPQPFREAVAVLTDEDDGLAIRSLPGESPPRVGGVEAEGRILAHGDRIELGDAADGQVIAFRGDPAGVGKPEDSSEKGPKPSGVQGTALPRARRRTPRVRANPWVTAVALMGGLLLLIGVYLALDRLSGLKADKRVEGYVPAPPALSERRAAELDQPALAYAEIESFEAEHPGDPEGAIHRYRDHLSKFPRSPEADRARLRIRELMDDAGRIGFDKLVAETSAMAREGRYRSALRAVRQFERRFGSTSSADKIEPLRREVRDKARAALDAFLAEIGPLVGTRPRAAHRALLAATPEYPPDLGAEITGLMERAIDLMRGRGGPPPEPRDRPPPAPVDPGMHPRDPTPPRDGDSGENGPPDDVFTEASAFQQWKEAYSDLTAKRYEAALKGYSLLVMRFGETETYRLNRAAIVAGRFAAKVGFQGPAGLLSVPVEEERGRLEVEYGFDDARVIQRDFTIEQPFPSDRPVAVETGLGTVRMADTTGLFHVIVWEPDVRVDARVVAEVAHDFGILAVGETDEFRAVMLNVNNTRFRLKKGSAARANHGHLLWFMGQGVWADADADAIGFIKIAERTSVKIENADRLNLELIRKGEMCEGAFHGRTDGVSLKGAVRGDDGGGLGAARIGLFTNTGVIVVEEMKISGKVDMTWFAKHLAMLIGVTRGPEDP